MGRKRKLVVLSHTHWDREWYLPFQEFRWKLVKLIDELLDVLAQDLDFSCFMLDGQTILLEDYLEVRPSRRQELQRFISSGRILVGPWYVLPDEFLVSGEALVRNLLMGDALAREFGEPMDVGYLPDQFGHISQMPQMLRGFGLDSAVVWRGVGDELTKTEFWWRSPDGTEVLALHLPDGYFNAQLLPDTLPELVERLTRIRERLEPRAATEYIVMMNGGDHNLVQPHVPALLKAANRALKDAEIIHGCLPKLMEAIRIEVSSNKIKLPVIAGELTNCKRAHLLPGVLSTRMWIKQRNAACENLLEKWAEPFVAWATLERLSQADAADAKSTLRLAWKHLLQNQPHDSICGCSIDEVHDEMRTRFNWSEGLAEGIIKQSLEQLAGCVDTAAGIPTSVTSTHPPPSKANSANGLAANAIPVVVFNPVRGPRTDSVTVTLQEVDATTFAAVDDRGRTYSCQVIERRCDPVSGTLETDLEFVAQDVPGHGYRTFYLVPNLKVEQPEGGRISETAIENRYFRIEVDPCTGTLQILDKMSGEEYRGLNLFVDGGDAGDEYNYDAPIHDTLVAGLDAAPRISVAESGPCRFTLSVHGTMSIPSAMADDRKSRKTDSVRLPITSYITVYPGVRRVDIHTEVDNTAKDHRLRVHFPTRIQSDLSHADGHFSVERRAVDLPKWSRDWIENPVGTHPQRSFVDVNDGAKGLLIANRGLPEYEASRSAEGLVVAITLLRCVGWLSRADLRSRSGQAGPIIPTPGEQCPGRHSFDYSLVPHIGGWQTVFHQAEQFGNSMRAQITSRQAGYLPHHLSFIEIEPGELVVSSEKLAERGNGIVVRVYNPTERTLQGRILTYRPFAKAALVNLREDHLSPLATDRNSLTLDITPSQIVTVRFDFDTA